MPDVLDVGEQLAALSRDGHDFGEFFRSPAGSLSLTVARWSAGTVDDQTPHTEDEVYFVLNGRAALVVEGIRTDVAPGLVAFVAAGDDHRFVDITEELEVLVFGLRLGIATRRRPVRTRPEPRRRSWSASAGGRRRTRALLA